MKLSKKEIVMLICIAVMIIGTIVAFVISVTITGRAIKTYQETIASQAAELAELQETVAVFNGEAEVDEDEHYNYFLGIDYRVFSYDTLQYNEEQTKLWQDHFTNWLKLNGIDPNPALDNNGYVVNEGLFYRFENMVDDVELPMVTDPNQEWASDPQTPDGVAGYGSDYEEPEIDESPSYYELLKVDAYGNLVMKDGSEEVYPEIIEEFNNWMNDYSDPNDTEYSRLEKYYGWYGVDVTERQAALMGGSDR